MVADDAVSQANLHLFSHIREGALSPASRIGAWLPASFAVAAFRHDSPSRSSSSFLISSSRNKDQFTMWRRDREKEGGIKAAATISSSETPLRAHSARRTDGQAIPFRPRKNGRRGEILNYGGSGCCISFEAAPNSTERRHRGARWHLSPSQRSEMEPSSVNHFVTAVLQMHDSGLCVRQTNSFGR